MLLSCHSAVAGEGRSPRHPPITLPDSVSSRLYFVRVCSFIRGTDKQETPLRRTYTRGTTRPGAQDPWVRPSCATMVRVPSRNPFESYLLRRAGSTKPSPPSTLLPRDRTPRVALEVSSLHLPPERSASTSTSAPASFPPPVVTLGDETRTNPVRYEHVGATSWSVSTQDS